MKNKKKKYRVPIGKWIGIYVMLVGVLIFSYPDIQEYHTEQVNQTLIWEFNERLQNAEESESQMNEKQNTDIGDFISASEELGEQIAVYNQRLYQEGQKDFKDAWSVEQTPAGIEKLRDGMFGYIEIPAMDCTMPVYIGASYEHMDLGAAVLGETSIPVGGCNTNSVIAGHRGWKRGKYWKEIEKVSPGDLVYLTNPWQTLTYRVASIAIIDPTDSERLKIQEGKDMVTLITCHPYRSHGKQRYVVYCVRDNTNSGIETDLLKRQTGEKQQMIERQNSISSKENIAREDLVRRACAMVILSCALIAVISNLRQKKTERSGQTK